MSDLEQIVRPSETGNVRPVNIIAGLRKAPAVVDPNEVVWGSAGNDVFQLQAHLQQEVNNRDEDEIQRKYDTVRIKSKDDPNTYVDVEVMTAYQSRNRIDKSRTELRFTPPEADANSEIIKRNQTRKSGE